MVVISAKRLRGVEVVLRKRKPARSNRCPGIDESKKDDTEFSVRTADEVPPFALNDLHVRPVIKFAGAIAIVAHKLEHQGIHLDGSNLPATRPECNNNVDAAP